MVKKVFALAGVSILTGLMMSIAAAGCSSTTTVVDNGDATDAAKDTSKPDTAEPPMDTSTVCPTSTPITAADIEANLTWLAPAAPQSVCAQADVDTLKGLFTASAGGDMKALTFTNISAKLAPACSACVFSTAASTTWAMFANYDSTAGTAVDNVFPSCFAQNATMGKTCGKARFEWQTCLDAACPTADCGSDAKASSCRGSTATQGGTCKDLTTAYVAACPDEAALMKTCGTIFLVMETNCGGGVDGGLDASSP